MIDHRFSGEIPVGSEDVVDVDHAFPRISQDFRVGDLAPEERKGDRGIVSDLVLGQRIAVAVEDLTPWRGNRKGEGPRLRPGQHGRAHLPRIFRRRLGSHLAGRHRRFRGIDTERVHLLQGGILLRHCLLHIRFGRHRLGPKDGGLLTLKFLRNINRSRLFLPHRQRAHRWHRRCDSRHLLKTGNRQHIGHFGRIGGYGSGRLDPLGSRIARDDTALDSRDRLLPDGMAQAKEHRQTNRGAGKSGKKKAHGRIRDEGAGQCGILTRKEHRSPSQYALFLSVFSKSARFPRPVSR